MHSRGDNPLPLSLKLLVLFFCSGAASRPAWVSSLTSALLYDLWPSGLEDRWKFIAINPQKEEGENGNHNADRQPVRIQKNMVEHDVDNHWPEQRQAKRHETAA